MYMYGSLSNRLDVIIRDGNKMALLVIDEHDDAVLPKKFESGNVIGSLLPKSSSVTAYQQRLLMFMQRMEIPVWCIKQRSNMYGPLRVQLRGLYNGTQKIITKTGYNAFKNTTLHSDLQSQGITHLVAMGWNANVCVAATLGVFTPRNKLEDENHGLGALQLGYKILSTGDILHGNGVISWAYHPSRMIEFFERF